MGGHAAVRPPSLGAEVGFLFGGADFGAVGPAHGFLQGDVAAGEDVALQEAMRWADRAEIRPTEKEAYVRAQAWRPYRGVAAHLLWRCYGGVKRGEIVLDTSSKSVS